MRRIARSVLVRPIAIRCDFVCAKFVCAEFVQERHMIAITLRKIFALATCSSLLLLGVPLSTADTNSNAPVAAPLSAD
jgi:hypothetical protein